jgi:peptidyl-prolyl cis-trans isomerase SurA
MSEIENKEKEIETVRAETEEQTTNTTNPKKKFNLKLYLGAFILVAAVLVAVLYQLEKEGRSFTNFFSEILATQEANEVVATVGGAEITNRELEVSIEQFAQMAVSQGVDITDESVQSEIRSQAIEVLINTELLKQEANDRGVSVSDEEVNARLESITEEIGGEEALNERMASLSIDSEQLQSDIREELTIQSLLEEVFAETTTAVTEEEVAAVYQEAGGSEAGLPPIEEVYGQIEAQIISSKEQELIDSLLADLRTSAEIEIVE